MINEEKFKVNLEGVLDVLANHLYSSEQVFVRELLQNAADAITARQLKTKADFAGEIHVEILGDAEQPIFIMQDNGIGLTETEVGTFLSSIGSSTKRDNIEADRDTFIGQFGIGLLSCFMISDTITVITQSANDKAIKWIGKIDGTYETTIMDKKLEVGTKVYIPIKKSKQHLFTNKLLKALLAKYGELLPYPISFAEENAASKILNNPEPIWEQKFGDATEQRMRILQYGEDTFDTKFFDYFDIDIPDLGVTGLAYLIPYKVSANNKQEQKVFLKKMLLSNNISNILPDWCFFIKVILNVNHLRPTASRESFYEDETLENLRLELGKIVKNYLHNIVRNDPKKLDKIIRVHGMAFKQMALDDDSFYSLILPHLKFNSNKGEISIDEIKEPTIYHVPDIDEFRKLAQIASYKGVTVINSGYVYDAQLLQKVARYDNEKTVELVNVNYFINKFEEVDSASIDNYDRIFELMNEVLGLYKCKPEIKFFEPDKLPTLYYMSSEVDYKRQLDNAIDDANELWGDLLGSMNKEVYNTDYSILCLNANNEMIQRLLGIENEALFKSIFSLLYVNALMLGHHALSSQEMSIVNNSLMDFINFSSKI